jgi:16S rRNA (cytosine1407-C5)-methyltransferase
MGRKRLRKNYKKARNKSQQRKYYTKEDIFLSRMASILQMSKRKVKHLFFQRIRTTIRINNLKTKPKHTYKVLTKSKGWELQKIKNLEYTYFVNNRDKNEVAKSQEYLDGKFYIQDLSSILSVYILNSQENESVLDLAAAPGSKTTLISSLTNNKAHITANDIDKKRISRLNNVLNQFGSKNVEVTNKDGKVLGKIYPNHFDKVLLDAPCSGEGRIYLGGRNPLRFWSIKMSNAMVKTQEQLIDSAFQALSIGGTLVYSTCTLEPEENEGVVTYLLNKYDNARMEDIDFVNKLEPLLKDKITDGITKWSGNTYHQEVAKSVRIIPSPEMMGFYIAKVIKT